MTTRTRSRSTSSPTPAKKAIAKKAIAKKAIAKKAIAKPAGAKPASAKKAGAKPKPASAGGRTSKAANKTIATDDSVEAFLAALPQPRRDECRALAAMMREATGAAAKMWGKGMVGFGEWHYRHPSGREGDFFELGFSPRKAALTVYVSGGLDSHAALLAKLGKHTTGKGCLYLGRLGDVDRTVLATLLQRGVAALRRG